MGKYVFSHEYINILSVLIFVVHENEKVFCHIELFFSVE